MKKNSSMTLKDFVEVITDKKDIDVVKSIFDDEIHYKNVDKKARYKRGIIEQSDEFDAAEDFAEEYEDDFDDEDEAMDEYDDEREDDD